MVTFNSEFFGFRRHLSACNTFIITICVTYVVIATVTSIVQSFMI